MAGLFVRGDREVRRIYRESYSLWGTGLSPEGYFGLWQDVRATGWGSRYIDFLTWEDGGVILSSMKRYRPRFHHNGVPARITVIGAVYTPARYRREGHAAAMIRAVLARAREEGDPFALLFTDIGTAYYRRLGFHAMPATSALARQVSCSPPAGGSVELTPVSAACLQQVRDAHEKGMERYDLRIVRDRAHWEFLLTRAERYFHRAAVAGGQRFRAARRDGRFLGYLVDLEVDGEWEIREVGAADGRPETMACILRAAAGPRVRTAYGWLPQVLLEALPDWDWTVVPRDRAIPMIATTDGTKDSDPPAGRLNSFFPYMDQF